jgi:hypothetical protein
MKLWNLKHKSNTNTNKIYTHKKKPANTNANIMNYDNLFINHEPSVFFSSPAFIPFFIAIRYFHPFHNPTSLFLCPAHRTLSSQCSLFFIPFIGIRYFHPFHRTLSSQCYASHSPTRTVPVLFSPKIHLPTATPISPHFHENTPLFNFCHINPLFSSLPPYHSSTFKRKDSWIHK